MEDNNKDDYDDEGAPCWCECCWGACFGCSNCFMNGGWRGLGIGAIIILICTFYLWGMMILMIAFLLLFISIFSGCLCCCCCCKIWKGKYWKKTLLPNYFCCLFKNPNVECNCLGPCFDSCCGTCCCDCCEEEFDV